MLWPSNTEKQADVHDVHSLRYQRAYVVLAESSRREEILKWPIIEMKNRTRVKDRYETFLD